MTDELTTRSARTSDLEAVITFWARAGENGSRPSDDVDAVRALIERDLGALIMAELGGEIIGTIVAGWDGWRANLYRLAVDPQERGRGLGRRLLASAEDRLAGLGATRFCAMVLDDNEQGRAFWSSSGYRPQDDWRRWVATPAERSGQ